MVNLQAKRRRADAGGHGAATVEPFSKTVNRVLSVRGFESPPLRHLQEELKAPDLSGPSSSAGTCSFAGLPAVKGER